MRRFGATEGVKLSGVLTQSEWENRTVNGRDFGEAVWDRAVPYTVPKVKAHRVNLSGKRTKEDHFASAADTAALRK